MNVLLTGSGGFIGRNIKEKLSSQYTLYSPKSEEVDLLDKNEVKSFLKKIKFDIVIHSAAINVGRSAPINKEITINDNLKMYDNLAINSDLFGRMFSFGSGAEFGKQLPVINAKEEEFGERYPADDYGKMKYKIQESIAKSQNIYNLRLFGIFGPYENYEIRFISNAICRAIYGLDIVIKKNVFFDYIYIDDFIRILEKFIQMPNIKFRDINVCSGNKIDLVSIAEKIQTVVNRKLTFNIFSKGLQDEYTGNNERLIKLIYDFKLTPIESSIKDLYDWYTLNINKVDSSKL